MFSRLAGPLLGGVSTLPVVGPVIRAWLGIYHVVSDGGAPAAGGDATAALTAFMAQQAAGKPHLYIPPGAFTWDPIAAPLIFTQDGGRLIGAGQVASQLTPATLGQIASGGHLVTFKGNSCGIDHVLLGPAKGQIVTSLTAGLTITQAGLSTGTLHVASSAKLATPGSGGAPATCYFGIAADQSTCPGLVIGYTGNDGAGNLTGCFVHAEWLAALTALLTTFSFPIANGQTVQLVPPPGLGSSAIRFGTTPGTDDVIGCGVGDDVSVQNWGVGFLEAACSKSKISKLTVTDVGYASWYRPDNASHADLGQEQATQFSFDSSFALFGIYHGNAGGISCASGKINKHVIAYRQRCDTGTATTNLQQTGIGCENFGLIGLWLGGGSTKFRNMGFTNGKLLCSTTAAGAVYCDVQADDVTFNGMMLRGDSAAPATQWAWYFKDGDNRRVGADNIVRGFNGPVLRIGPNATHTHVAPGFEYPDGPTIIQLDSSAGASAKVGHYGRGPFWLYANTAAAATAAACWTFSMTNTRVLRVVLRANGSASGGTDVELRGVVKMTSGNAYSFVADSGYPIANVQGGTSPVWSLVDNGDGTATFKLTPTTNAFSGDLELEVLGGRLSTLSVPIAGAILP